MNPASKNDASSNLGCSSDGARREWLPAEGLPAARWPTGWVASNRRGYLAPRSSGLAHGCLKGHHARPSPPPTIRAQTAAPELAQSRQSPVLAERRSNCDCGIGSGRLAIVILLLASATHLSAQSSARRSIWLDATIRTPRRLSPRVECRSKPCERGPAPYGADGCPDVR